MGNKSSIERLPADVRKRVRQLLRDNQLTLDEIRDEIREEFGVEWTPARTPLWREKQKIEEFAQEMREMEAVTETWVREIKDAPDGKTGRLMLQMLRSLAFKAVSNARDRQTKDPKELQALARAFNLIESGGKRNLETERLLREEARAQLLREQDAKVDKLVKDGGLSKEAGEAFRRDILGIRPKAPPAADGAA